MRVALICTALLILLTVGCSSIKHYEGPTLPKSKIAVILKGQSFSSRGPYGGMFILGKLKSSGSAQYKSMGNHSEVLPGEVHFGVTLAYIAGTFGRQLRNGSLRFIAEGGKTYVVHGWSGLSPGAWVLDIDSGIVVARTGNIPEQVIAESQKSL